jgi:DNA-binding transcriptional ArsR family regulator
MRPITEIDDPKLAKVMSHPLRVRILRALEDGMASPNQIARRLGAPLPNVSYHVRALERAGLIVLEKTEPRRGAVEHYYKSAGRMRVSDKAWRDVPAIVKARLVDSALGQIGELAAGAAVGGGFEREDALLSRQGFVLDEKGFREAHRVALEFIDAVRTIESESQRRLRDEQPHAETALPTCLAVMLFENVGGVTSTTDASSRKPRGKAAASGR